MRDFYQRKQKMEKFGLGISDDIFRCAFLVKWSNNQISFSTTGIWFSNKRVYPILADVTYAPRLRRIDFILVNPIKISSDGYFVNIAYAIFSPAVVIKHNTVFE